MLFKKTHQFIICRYKFSLFFLVGEGLHPAGLRQQEEGPALHCQSDLALGEPGGR